MPEKRKDSKGRVLKTGESQRKDGRYQYRYTDAQGNRVSIYGADLRSLRAREEEISQARQAWDEETIDAMTVRELLDLYISLKQGVRYGTKTVYGFVSGVVGKEPFGERRITGVRVSDAKRWILKLHKDGRGYGTITTIKSVVCPAFRMACEDGAIQKNPFEFRLSDVIPNDTPKKAPLTPAQLEAWMGFIRSDKTYRKYYDEFLVLLGTGMRAGELCGLTFSDIDFRKGRIRIERQMIKKRDGTYSIGEPKTGSGYRYIPISPEVRRALKRIMENRRTPEKEPTVDGCSGFLLLDRNMHPKTTLTIDNEMRAAYAKYCRLYPDAEPLPKVTPHVLRHTFCTNMAQAGMEVKALQYIMGHSDAGVTLNVYTHSDYSYAERQMSKALSKANAKSDVSKTDAVYLYETLPEAR